MAERTPVQSQVLSMITADPAVAYAEPAVFDQLQRGASILAASELTPQSFAGSVPNCFGAVIISARMNLTPYEVMQNLYVIRGRACWSSKFLIARLQSTRRYKFLDWEEIGTPLEDDWAFRYWGVTNDEAEVAQRGPWISIAMAKQLGWYSKRDSYWQKEPELMLRYRSAARFISLYAPDTTLGFLTREEVFDVVEDEPAAGQPSVDALNETLRAVASGQVVEGEVVSEEVVDETTQDDLNDIFDPDDEADAPGEEKS